MRDRNGYGLAGNAPQAKRPLRTGGPTRKPVTARGRAVLENSRRRAANGR